MARPPRPDHMKLVEGNPGNRPPRSPLVLEGGKPPSCPKQLTKIAKKEWRRIVPILMNSGLLNLVDMAGLAAYCQSYARWLEAEQHVAESTMVVKTVAGNQIENPYYSITKRERELMHKFLGEFGLTPAARMRINLKPTRPSDPLSKFLAG